MEFVHILEKEYGRRVASNPSYSLRAYARDLAIDQSALTKVLARKRTLSDEVILRVAANLKLSVAQAKKFLNKSISVPNHPEYIDLEYDSFVAISDWYHDALLELIDTVDFKADTKWISRRLQIKESHVRAAIKRLQNLNLLEINDGKWIDKSKANSIHPGQISAVALKTHQKQILNCSLRAIDTVDLAERSHTSNTFSASKENIEDAKRLITKCRKDVAAIMRSSKGPKTEVYQIQISLFPTTKRNGAKL